MLLHLFGRSNFPTPKSPSFPAIMFLTDPVVYFHANVLQGVIEPRNLIHPWRWTSGTCHPWRFGSNHVPFISWGDGCRFQLQKRWKTWPPKTSTKEPTENCMFWSHTSDCTSRGVTDKSCRKDHMKGPVQRMMLSTMFYTPQVHPTNHIGIMRMTKQHYLS